MDKQITKAELFDNFFNTAIEVIPLIESTFDLTNGSIFDQVFGIAEEKISLHQADAKEHLKKSDAWRTLSNLYDYAVDGYINSSEYSDIEDAAGEIVIGAAEVISIVTTESNGPSEDWDRIIMMGDGRFALDIDSSIDILKLALLANVDVRTVRNAISAGDLTSEKIDNVVLVDSQSALLWLSKRRAYTPTKFIRSIQKELNEVNSATEFGMYLHSLRGELDISLPEANLEQGPVTISPSDIKNIESGIFKLPINSVDVLASYYQVNKKELLNKIMKIFFSEQLRLIIETQPK